MNTHKFTIKETIVALIGVAAVWGLIPKEHETQLLETITVVSPIVGMIMRQWFSSTTVVWDE